MWEWTYGQLFLQAVVEVFGLVGLQLLEGDPRLADELVVAEFVLVTHRDPGGEEGWGRRRRVALKPSFYTCCPSDAARHQTDLILARVSVLDSKSASSLEALERNDRRSAAAESPCGLPEEGIAEFWPL